MKAMKFYGMAIIMALVSVCLTACSSDDDGTSNNPIVGTWVYTDYHYDGNVYIEKITFKADGTGVVEYYNQKDEKDLHPETFKYTLTDTTITFDYGDGNPGVYHYIISGNKVTVDYKGGRTYIKQ